MSDASRKRAPAHSKTAFSVPTNKLARELVGRFVARGTHSVRRIFGPLSEKRPDGSPECRIHEQAAALARGGLSVPWELCEGRGKSPCEYAETCGARGGADGPEDARIVIGPHAMLSQVAASVGRTGLLVIDEPPDLLQHELLTSEELTRAAADVERYFEHPYSAAVSESLRQLSSWVTVAPLDAPGELARGVTPATLDAIRSLRKADHDRPPLTFSYVSAARRHLVLARSVGEAARVAKIVVAALTGEPGHSVARVETRRASRALIVTLPNVQFREALRREGATVVCDANGRANLQLYQMACGHAPRVTEVHTGDGAPIERCIIRRRASRAGWMQGGRLLASGGLDRALRQIVAWILERPEMPRVAIVTLRPIAIALRASLGEDVEAEWKNAGQDGKELKLIASRFAGILRALPAQPDVGHFGAIRGLDEWRDHDAIVTLGDPWGQLTDARWEAELLKLSQDRYEERARAELEQAHGRLRVVHRRRPGRALHVGMLVPGGWENVGYETREDDGGSPRKLLLSPSELRSLVLREGGIKPAARLLGVTPKALRKRLAGGDQHPIEEERVSSTGGWSPPDQASPPLPEAQPEEAWHV